MIDRSTSLYLRNLGQSVMELARAAKTEADRTGDAFQRGRSHGLYQVVSLMVQQAEALDLDRREVGLTGIEPDRDLL